MFEKIIEVIVITLVIGIVFAGVYVAFDSRYKTLDKMDYFDTPNNPETERLA